MFEGAYLKIDRAEKHVAELNELIRETPPFMYTLETNGRAGDRATYAKRNEAAISDCALIAGDAVHNLRSALDHAYWLVVSPHANSPREERAVQFPFSETAARLEEAVKNRLADRAGPKFFDAIMKLLPHGEAAGNEMLYLVHELDVIDKHRLLIPAGDYKRISFEMLRAQIPDFPAQLVGGIALGSFERDIVWELGDRERAALGITTHNKFEQQLDVPVDIVFAVAAGGRHRPMVPTLHQLVDVARATIDAMRPVGG